MKITTTGEFLAVLPHQLGHQLEDCVVVAMVRDKVLGPVARTDLPCERDAPALAAQFLASLLRVEPELALIVGYETVPGASRTVRHRLHAGLRRAGVGIIDHVVVRDDSWWGACCRPSPRSLDGLVPGHLTGHALPDPSRVAAVAELVVNGSAPLASRDEVSALVAEDRAASAGVREALDRLDGACADTVDPVPDLWARVLAPEGTRGERFEATDDEVARMLHSLRDKQWRDALVACMSAVMFPLDLVDDASSMLLAAAAPAGPVRSATWSRAVLQRLLSLTRRVPDGCAQDAAAICTVTACVAWGIGNGSTAGDAVDRALWVRPGYTLAEYLGRLIEFQVRPRRQWSDVAA
ncbi:hypothetical protein N801_04405 [Knoellia aerolata DSM 18566]|uniref:DUF4192 domain-containing protein n=1 Tax=Knoellia aerolata DSM 18566 TaxID=1385519 RepID=A0A0A0JYF6_9MICO|nr:hypothetical protein N801_04405 [Knoellia aerolata DSM 18566]